MSQGESEKGTFAKGDRAKIVAGKKGIGMAGEVFWTGENKYGPGLRYGLRGDDGQTYWVDQTQIAPSDSTGPSGGPSNDGGGSRGGAGPDPAGKFDKGDEVELVRGAQVGQRGVIFWTGKSRYGVGARYGLKNDDDQTIWADESEVKLVSKGSGASEQRSGGRSTTSGRPANASGSPATGSGGQRGMDGGNDDLPPEAFAGPAMSIDDLPAFDAADNSAEGQAEELPPEAFEQPDDWR